MKSAPGWFAEERRLDAVYREDDGLDPRLLQFVRDLLPELHGGGDGSAVARGRVEPVVQRSDPPLLLKESNDIEGDEAVRVGVRGGDVETAVLYALWINVGWGLINLAPIMPLDGGNALRSTIKLVTGVDKESLVRKISIACITAS